MIQALMKENMKNTQFRNRATFIPRYLASKGIVINPTVVRVEMNTAICIRPAPFFNNSTAIGKAIKTGMMVNEPVNADRISPGKPDCEPMIASIVLGFKKARIIPTRSKIAINCGNRPTKIFKAFFKAKIVFGASFVNDMISNSIAKTYIMTGNIIKTGSLV